MSDVVSNSTEMFSNRFPLSECYAPQTTDKVAMKHGAKQICFHSTAFILLSIAEDPIEAGLSHCVGGISSMVL